MAGPAQDPASSREVPDSTIARGNSADFQTLSRLPAPALKKGAAFEGLPALPPFLAPVSVQGGRPQTAPRRGPRQPGQLPSKAGVLRLRKEAPPKTLEVLLFLAEGADPRAVAKDHGLRPKNAFAGNPDIWVFSAPTAEAAALARVSAAADRRVTASFLNRKIKMAPMWVPDDPYFSPITVPAGSFPGQWHLANSSGYSHANLLPAWSRNLTGSGVLISIVDDGLETTHPDIAANYVAAYSLNWGPFPPNSNVEPDPVYDGSDFENRHGTCVAGVAAAVGGNGAGVTGAAPHASVAMQRIDWTTMTDSIISNAILYHSSGSSTEIKIKNHSYGAIDPYNDNQPQMNALATSAAAGTIQVFSAGNNRFEVLEDANKRQPQNSPDAITVAALGSNAKYASYSCFGANVFVTAPSSSSSGLPRVTTTDRQGVMGYAPNSSPTVQDPFPDTNYTSGFGGTSSSAPLVAGILALAKQANPNLSVRMAQHALVRSSNIVDPNDATIEGDGDFFTSGSAWKTNGAGFRFNQNYGFGLIDADRLTQQVLLYSGVSPLQTESTGNVSVATLIPDNSAVGVTRTFVLSGTIPLESVQVSLNLTHPFRGDLEAYLTSPSGTVSRLFLNAGDPDAFPDPSWATLNQWTFLTHAFWGEHPAGTWTLNVRDPFNLDEGTWNSFTVVTRMGRPTLAGIVLDGGSGADISTQSSTTTMSAHWTGFSDPTIPVASFAWAIGTSPGGDNVLPYTNVGLETSASTGPNGGALSLQPGATYYVTVRATDNKGVESFITSNGVQITGIAESLLEAPLLHALAESGSVNLEWQPSPSPGVSHYRLWWKAAGSPWSSAAIVDNLVGTTTSVGGLTNGVSYHFALRAVTAAGNESPGSVSLATPGPMITVNGSGNYGTIQAAINAAASILGTVRVQSGAYAENLVLPPGVSLIGASPDHTILTSPTGSTDVITVTGTFGANPQSFIGNLRVTGGRIGIVAGSADVLVRNVVVHDLTSHGITSGFFSRLQAINCTLARNGGDGVQALGTTVVRNVIAASNGGFGINAPNGSLVTYSNSYGNPGGNYTTGIVDGSDASVPVAFADPAADDFTELPGSVSIDAGDPADGFALEPNYNGARINQGAFGNTEWAGRSPVPLPFPKGGGGGGGCGLSGLEGFLLLLVPVLLRRRRG